MERPKGDVVLNFCYLSILFLSLFNFLSPIPISLQLFFISMSCIYIGSRRGIIIQEKYDRVEKSDKEEKEREKMTVKDALLFLVYGSIVLLGLYFAYRIFDQNLLNLVLSFHFTIFGFLSLVQLFCYHIDKAVPEWEKILVFKRKYHLNLYVYSRTFNIAINRSEVIAGLIAIPATFGYFFTKHWLLNNLLGIAFSICGIESLVLPSFQIGFVLLWGLFLYDVFWVYGTDVMVTVAKAVDAPIKLLLPMNLATHKDSFSMLGLGDIIVPGVFIALCLKYDVDKAIINFRRQGIKEFDFNLISTPYFNWCLGGYALGMILTYNALLIFNHAQPALFFLVPCCTLSVLICAMKNREMKGLFEYSEEHIRQSIGEMALVERYKEK